MSRQLVSRSDDLTRLQAEGFDLQVRAGNLVVQVPYVTTKRKIAQGFLVSELTVEGERTATPATHVIHFVGASPEDLPCTADGQPLENLIHQRLAQPMGDGLTANCSFSRKPPEGYPNYYEKMATYASLLYAQVQQIDPTVPLHTFPPVPAEEDQSVFRYFDSMTSRSEIGAVTEKLAGQRIAIIGLGGTGSYVLDAVSKTPVAEIHLYDADAFMTHNAFRSPGAASLTDLETRPLKVDYHHRRYDAIHRHVAAHPVRMTTERLDELAGMSFVFLTIDTSPTKLELFEGLQRRGVPFVDCGMGLYQTEASVGGIVRTSFSAPTQDDPAWINSRTDFSEVDNAYDQNIQIAELNMLNAALAVLAWKKHAGFYVDLEHQSISQFSVDGNHLLNEGAVGAN